MARLRLVRRREVLADVVGHSAPVLPDQVAGRGVQRLRNVAGVREEQDAVVNQRRTFLIAAIA
jgi:hypothetical protein